MQRSDLAIVITARMAAERLPGKVLADVAGKPLLGWLIERLQPIANVIIGTTSNDADIALVELGQHYRVPVYRNKPGEVIACINQAVELYAPTAKYILRGLGDCPFMATELVIRAVDILDAYNGEAFCWYLAPYVWPVYGSREFPYSRIAWQRIVERSRTHEHSDMYFHEHREEFKIIYHEPPSSTYFRNYRLEVDWPEDLELVRQIATGPGMLAPITKIIRFLDANHELTRINAMRTERTGPTCYTYEDQRQWTANMRGQPIVSWQNIVWRPPTDKSQPVFCTGGKCLLGFAEQGILHTKNAMIKGEARLTCDCGDVLVWRAKS